MVSVMMALDEVVMGDEVPGGHDRDSNNHGKGVVENEEATTNEDGHGTAEFDGKVKRVE
jgi:hypothetical protein